MSAPPANTLTSYEAKGNREDLENVIYTVAAIKTPFTQAIGKAPVTATFHEWQTFTNRTPNADNKNLQGGDVALTAAKTTARVGNRTQIFIESGGVSGTQDAVDAAGRPREMAFQVAKKGEELATDIEARFLANKASVTGDNDSGTETEAECAGSLAWLSSNVSRGSGGSSGGFSGSNVAAATNGTQRPFTESQLKAVQASAFSNGAPGMSLIFMSATHKQVFSTFSGIADIRVDAKPTGMATIVGAAAVYVGDFGTLTAIPVQYGLTRDVLLIDPSMWAVGTLRPMAKKELAKTGDSEKFMLSAEKTLICRSQRASAVIADLS